MKWRPPPRGLTLIEVLVALALVGLISALMVKGLDVITRNQALQTEINTRQSVLQSSLAQWQTDLNLMDATSTLVPALDWNGRVLRVLRYQAMPANGQRLVVAWGLRQGRWVRWQSQPLSERAELSAAWEAALAALNAEDANRQIAETVRVSGWRVFFFRNDSWSNALSSSGTATPSTPDAVRLQIDLTPDGRWQGALQWDWVRPTWSASRS
jgi:general secretion pathway protein J